MAYGDFKDLARRTASDKVLRDKAFNIAKNPQYDGYQRGLASMVYKFFDKKFASLADKSTAGSGVNKLQNEQLPEELHKPIIRNFKKREVYSGFKDNIWGADLVDMQSIRKLNKGFRFLLCVINILSKYAWVVPLKDKKDLRIVNAFQKVLDKPDRKTNKIWADKRSEFYYSSFKKWFKDNDIEKYSIHNEGKSVVAKRLIRTLKSKIYKYMASVSKGVYTDKLDDAVNEYNNTYHRKIKMKPVDVKDNAYIDFSKKINNKDPKFKVGDHIRISKYKNIFAKDNTLNWSAEVFVIKEVKNTVPWT